MQRPTRGFTTVADHRPYFPNVLLLLATVRHHLRLGSILHLKARYRLVGSRRRSLRLIAVPGASVYFSL